MRPLRAFFIRLGSLFNKQRRDRDFAEEIESHLQLHIDDNLRAGMAFEDARRAAVLKLGGIESVKENHRDRRGIPMFESLLKDVRYASRTMRRSPGFTIVAILTLGIGIGANSAMFSLADGLLLRPLPVPRASAVVTVRSSSPNNPSNDVSYPDYLDFRDRNSTFENLTASMTSTFGFNTKPDALPKLKLGMYVSGNFFRALGVEPAIGRGFRPDEDTVPGRDAVVVLSHGLWKDEFGGNPSAIGKRVRLNGLELTVIGVAPEHFTGIDRFIRPAFYLPLAMTPPLLKNNLLEDRGLRSLMVKGRLKPGVSIEQAKADVNALAHSLELTYPTTNRNQSAVVQTELTLNMESSPPDTLLVGMLMALSFCVLMVACANLAGLLLSRARARSREIAVRLAIGSSRFQLIRQLLIESMLTALAGGLTGVLVAYGGVRFFSQLQIPTDLPLVLDFHVDVRVLFFTLGVSLLSAILFGLIPALQASHPSLVPALKASDADSSGPRRLWGRNLLVIVQVAVSLMLITVSAVLFRGFDRQLTPGPGFRTDHLLMMSFDPTLIHYTKPQSQQFFRQLAERVRSTPGVRTAGLSKVIPASPNQSGESVVPEGYQFPKGIDSANLLSDIVDERYFDVMGIRILQGRGFLQTDDDSAPKVAVVNEEFAKKYWPQQNPLGKRFQQGKVGGPWVQVVGVAKTSKYLWIGESPTEFLYLPFAQNPQSRMTLFAQSESDSASLLPAVRQVVRELDPNQPVYDVRTMESYYEQRIIKAPTMIVQAVASMGMSGMILAMIGLYGLMAHSVARRTREIGLRMAIGATQHTVLRMVLTQGFQLTIAGIVIGLIGGLAAERAVGTLFTWIGSDPAIHIVTPTAMLAITLLAAYLPARRASLVDPIKALRDE